MRIAPGGGGYWHLKPGTEGVQTRYVLRNQNVASRNELTIMESKRCTKTCEGGWGTPGADIFL